MGQCGVPGQRGTEGIGGIKVADWQLGRWEIVLGRHGQQCERPLEAKQNGETALPWSLQEGTVTCSTVFGSKPPTLPRGGGGGATSAPLQPTLHYFPGMALRRTDRQTVSHP